MKLPTLSIRPNPRPKRRTRKKKARRRTVARRKAARSFIIELVDMRKAAPKFFYWSGHDITARRDRAETYSEKIAEAMAKQIERQVFATNRFRAMRVVPA